MKVYCTDSFDLPLPANHRFPIEKYRMLRERVVAELGQRVECVIPAAATDAQLGRVHDTNYLHKVCAGDLTEVEQKRIGFPWSAPLVERSRRSTGATIEAAHAALSEGIAVNLAGGTHHASATRGQGFCVFNDVAVAIRDLQSRRLIRQALVIDCDVHQGNGTAAIFADDATVFTFSMHGDRNFPFAKTAGDLDIAMRDGSDDKQYLAALAEALSEKIPWATVNCVFYLAGADAFAGDRLGRLNLTKNGLRTRDQKIFAACQAANLPLVVAMAGGYGRDLNDTVDIHLSTVRGACDWLDGGGSGESRCAPTARRR